MTAPVLEYLLTDVAIGGLFGGLAVAQLVDALGMLRKKREIEDRPTSTVRGAARGNIELAGMAVPLPGQAPSRAPFTGRRCVWWRVDVWRMDPLPSLIWLDVSGGPILLEDETGRAVIDIMEAALAIEHTDTWYGDTPRPEGGPEAGRAPLGAGYRYRERRIPPGAKLYVRGWFEGSWGDRVEGRVQADSLDVIDEWKMDYAGFVERFDTDGDGRVDLYEYEDAKAEARRAVGEQVGGAEGALGVVMAPPVGAFGEAFVVSSRPEKAVVTGFGRKFWPRILWSLFCTGLLVLYVWARIRHPGMWLS